MITIPYRGQILALDRATFDEAARRGRELAAAYAGQVDTGDYLSVREVIERTGYCRASIYSLMRRKQFPVPIIMSAPGRQRRVAWRSPDVVDWLRRRRHGDDQEKARYGQAAGSKKKTKTTEGRQHHVTESA